MKKKLAIISLLLITILPSQAQCVLKGVIVDESNTTIPAVTVRILNTDSSFVAGSVTDDRGLFVFDKVETGNYIVAISSIGYTSLFPNVKMPRTNYELPAIALKEDNVTLDAVTVIGNSFIQKKDHLLIIPDKQQIKHAFSGYDLLYNLIIHYTAISPIFTIHLLQTIVVISLPGNIFGKGNRCCRLIIHTCLAKKPR